MTDEPTMKIRRSVKPGEKAAMLLVGEGFGSLLLKDIEIIE